MKGRYCAAATRTVASTAAERFRPPSKSRESRYSAHQASAAAAIAPTRNAGLPPAANSALLTAVNSG